LGSNQRPLADWFIFLPTERPNDDDLLRALVSGFFGASMGPRQYPNRVRARRAKGVRGCGLAAGSHAKRQERTSTPALLLTSDLERGAASTTLLAGGTKREVLVAEWIREYVRQRRNEQEDPERDKEPVPPGDDEHPARDHEREDEQDRNHAVITPRSSGGLRLLLRTSLMHWREASAAPASVCDCGSPPTPAGAPGGRPERESGMKDRAEIKEVALALGRRYWQPPETLLPQGHSLSSDNPRDPHLSAVQLNHERRMKRLVGGLQDCTKPALLRSVPLSKHLSARSILVEIIGAIECPEMHPVQLSASRIAGVEREAEAGDATVFQYEIRP
jgi:hypothetical protein